MIETTMQARILLILFSCLASAWGGTNAGLYYNGYAYGSQASFNPFFILVNGSYDMVQTQHVSNRVTTINYSKGFRNVNRNLSHPFRSIEQYGWSEFVGDELLPTDPTVENSQWVPNYTLHMIGGGLTYRTLVEWYAYHGSTQPALMAAINCMAYHYVNEAVENGENQDVNVDAIADFLIFNPLGILMFSNDRIATFFSRDLHAANWSSLPVVNLGTGQLDNMALSFSFKYFPFESKPLGLFYFTGMNTALGLTWRYAKDYSFSAGMGVGTVGIYKVDQANGERKLTAALGRTAGFFWDRNNSLLASLILSEQRRYRARLNVYPLPAMERFIVKPGFFLGYGQGREVYLGLSLNMTPMGLSGFSSL